jgi:hypothetical protein
MLGKLWGILQAAIPKNISISRTISLVHALAKLHNFCINERHGSNYNVTTNEMVPDSLEQDNDHLMMQSEGCVTMDADDNNGVLVPRGLMNGGHHFDNMPRALRKTHGAKTQRELLRNKVINSHMTIRPTKRLVRLRPKKSSLLDNIQT